MNGIKKSQFSALQTIADAATLDFVINGQNFKISKTDFLAALGVTGVLTQGGAVTGAPVLDLTSPPNYIIRNLENGPGVKASTSPENGITIEHNIRSGSLGLPVFTDTTESQPLIRSLLAGDNVSITVDGDALQIDAAIGTVPNTVIVQELADFPAPVGNLITLPVGSPAVYVIKGNVILGLNVLQVEGGNSITGDTAATSSITSSSASPTITFTNGGFKAAGVTGNVGITINNTGGGAAIRADGVDNIVAIRRLFTSECGTALEINDSNVLLDSWTVVGSVNGIVLTGTLSSGPIIDNFNPIGLTGKGIYINGDIASNDLRVNKAIINDAVGNGVEIASGKTIKGFTFTGSSTSTGANGMKIAGAITEGLLIDDATISSTASDGMDITGGTLSTLVVSASAILSIGAAAAGLKGDAASANITFTAILTSSNIQGIGGGSTALSGITKKDLKYRFTQAGAAITDSANIGGFTLDTQTNTVITYQGYDGANTIYADSATSPGVRTLVTSTGHTLPAGTSISITGTTSYNGLHTVSNVLANTYEIDVVFVANDATGNYQSGWEKVAGSTTDIESIERFNGTNDNEIESLDAKTIPVTYSATISGEKVGSPARLCQFALFLDAGTGFVKVDGEATIDVINRIKSTTLRVPFEMSEGGLATLYCRNTEGTDDYISDAFSVDIGIS
jgi:hypothetical protein